MECCPRAESWRRAGALASRPTRCRRPLRPRDERRRQALQPDATFSEVRPHEALEQRVSLEIPSRPTPMQGPDSPRSFTVRMSASPRLITPVSYTHLTLPTNREV